MRPIARMRSRLRLARPPFPRSARARLGGTNGRAENQTRLGGTRGRCRSPQQRSDFGDAIGRLARKLMEANDAFFSGVFLGELSPSLTNRPVIRLNDEALVASGRRMRRGSLDRPSVRAALLPRTQSNERLWRHLGQSLRGPRHRLHPLARLLSLARTDQQFSQVGIRRSTCG